MKFIISGISMNLFQDKDFDLKIHELSEDEFQAIAYDAFSYIGQQDVADATGFAYNRESFKARVGDILLLAQIYHKTLRFYCIQVCPSETPLLREEELDAFEEMI